MSISVPPVSAEMLSLRANMELAGVPHPRRSIAIASLAPPAPTVSLILGLGQAFAAVDLDVLLVDANSQDPILHHVLDSSVTPGLYQCLADRNQELPLQDTPVSGIRFLAAGAQDKDVLEVLSKDRIQYRQRELLEMGQLIFWHVPPLSASPAGALIASQVDATLLVLRPGFSRRSPSLRVKQQLEQAGAHIMGTVLLKVPRRRDA